MLISLGTTLLSDLLTEQEQHKLAPDVRRVLDAASVASGAPLVDVEGLKPGRHCRVVPGMGKTTTGRK